jgi:hypothetical protein
MPPKRLWRGFSHDALSVVVEMSQAGWGRFVADLHDMTPEEADWRPLPQANGITLISATFVSRLSGIWPVSNEARPCPTTCPPSSSGGSTRFRWQAWRYRPNERMAARHSRRTSLAFTRRLTLASHLRPIRTLRNLYRKTRGEPTAFHPDNPTYP